MDSADITSQSIADHNGRFFLVYRVTWGSGHFEDRLESFDFFWDETDARSRYQEILTMDGPDRDEYARWSLWLFRMELPREYWELIPADADSVTGWSDEYFHPRKDERRSSPIKEHLESHRLDYD